MGRFVRFTHFGSSCFKPDTTYMEPEVVVCQPLEGTSSCTILQNQWPGEFESMMDHFGVWWPIIRATSSIEREEARNSGSRPGTQEVDK